MKQIPYAAGVVSYYRKYIDLFLSGQETQVSEGDYRAVLALGNRCGFTDGYYHRHNGSDMVTFTKPNYEKTNEALQQQILRAYENGAAKIPVMGELVLHQGQAAYYRVKTQTVSVEISGMEVMQHIRQSSTVPIIIVSAKDTDADKTLGLGLGADDYITKPFSVTEVLARIKANIRRSTQYSKPAEPENETLVIGDLVMNLTDYTVTKKNVRVDLTAKEYEILKLLLQNPKKVYTKEQMYSLIWNDAYLGDENAVNVHISRLRNKIEDNPRSPKYVITVWGIGYKLGDLS